MDHCFVVVEPDPIVRMDVAGALEHNFPTSRVEDCNSLDDLEQLLVTARGPVSVFVNGAMLSELSAHVLKPVVEGGGQVVSIGGPAAPSIHATTLDVPFSTAMILEALPNVLPCPPAHQPEGRT
ncbi:hypothetical protein [Tateyamaria sp. SN3-11]|uniref:hypothetical protein n=1 Tax=Tateyamaria sp. SN3-11 TaxID=3092147 RepID=UPI0039E8DC44